MHQICGLPRGSQAGRQQNSTGRYGKRREDDTLRAIVKQTVVARTTSFLEKGRRGSPPACLCLPSPAACVATTATTSSSFLSHCRLRSGDSPRGREADREEAPIRASVSPKVSMIFAPVFPASLGVGLIRVIPLQRPLIWIRPCV